ncbi:uncharacterized protein LOC129984506 [Argiope bruennichi]|uniref:uncharacterized protein LOC129984506 n=1 Tax=Argiope bruennichi TaxID=94029 RepID=UPI002494A6B9|nr:uncharacterized protein LOC129984506 [Argiope bruennichi]XP_055950375.1 uncharacterized protein LOC129984506 [Argiope bruennichi]
MSITFVPNLQMMACVQTAIPILNSPEIQKLINCYSLGCSENIDMCNMIEKTATEKIQNLALTSQLQAMVKDFLMNMFSEIIECKSNYSLFLTEWASHVNQNFKFFWKSDGTIDQRKSVKSLIENEDVNVKERFLLASNYCLIDASLSLWKTMTETQNIFSPLELECHRLAKFWIEIFKEESSHSKISPQILESSILQNNVHMLRYVMQMLPYEKQRPYLLSTTSKDDINAKVMIFCLSRLDECDQEKVFKNCPMKVLQCVLTWPYQYMFMNVANRLWAYLSKESFCDILWLILRKMMHQEWSDFRLIENLKEFWFECPAHFKEYAKQQSVFGLLIVILHCDMRYFPRCELNQACIRSLEEFLHRICLNDL